MKEGRSSADLKENDIIYLKAKNLKIVFLFNEDKTHYNEILKLLRKFCVQTNLKQKFKVIKPLGKGGFASVSELPNNLKFRFT